MHAHDEFNSHINETEVLNSSETAHDPVGNVKGGKIDYINFDIHLRGDSNLFHKLVDDGEENDFHKSCGSAPTISVVTGMKGRCNPLRQRRSRNRESYEADSDSSDVWSGDDCSTPCHASEHAGNKDYVVEEEWSMTQHSSTTKMMHHLMNLKFGGSNERKMR